MILCPLDAAKSEFSLRMIGKETLEKKHPHPVEGTSGSTAAAAPPTTPGGEKGVSSFQELTRKHRVAARRDKRRGQPSASDNNNKAGAVALSNKARSQDVPDPRLHHQQETQHIGKFPRSVSQDGRR